MPNEFPDRSSPPDAGSKAPLEPESPRPEPELPRWATKTRIATPLSETRFAAFIGSKWERTYRVKLARFLADPSFTPTWNWAAFLGQPFWFLYRKLYMAFAAFYFMPMVAGQLLIGEAPEGYSTTNMFNQDKLPFTVSALGITLSLMIAAGGTGNWLLFRRARAAAIVASAQQLPDDATLSWMERVGGVNRLFTGLFIAVSIVLSLAALAQTA